MQKRVSWRVCWWWVVLGSHVFTSSCPSVEGLGNPIHIFHRYFKQTIKIFDPSQKETSAELMYYRVQRKKSHVHRFVFRLRNTYANRFEYVGIVSVVPSREVKSGRHKHFVIRYINSADLLDTATLLGIYEIDRQRVLGCPHMKQLWLEHLVKDPYIVTRTPAHCVSSGDLTRMFSFFFEAFRRVLDSFGVTVSKGQLGFDETVLDIVWDVYRDFDFIQVEITPGSNPKNQGQSFDRQSSGPRVSGATGAGSRFLPVPVSKYPRCARVQGGGRAPGELVPVVPDGRLPTSGRQGHVPHDPNQRGPEGTGDAGLGGPRRAVQSFGQHSWSALVRQGLVLWKLPHDQRDVFGGAQEKIFAVNVGSDRNSQ